MRLAILLCGLLVCLLGIAALRILPERDAFPFFQGALTLGGGWLICFGFSFRMLWHGILGAGVLALLGMARGLGNIPKFFPPQSPNTQSYLELAITALSAALLARVLTTLFQEKSRRQAQALRDS